MECGQPPMSLGKKGKAIIVLKKHSGHLEHFPVVHSLEQRLLPCVFGQNMVSMIETNLAAGIDTVLSFPEFQEPCPALVIEIHRETVKDHSKVRGDFVIEAAVAHFSLPGVDSGGEDIL